MQKLFIITLLFFTACTPSQVSTGNKFIAASNDPGLVVDGKLFSTLFQQKAAEYRALCFQAYNIARYRIDEYKPQSGKPKAIITDLDETIFDNSPYAAFRGLQGKDYEQASWYEWTARGIADSIPGSVSFFSYAASKGITIFYVTNRNLEERAGTIKNLQLLHLPFADEAHLLMRTGSSSKEQRRQSIFSTHEIMMLVGDNLSDFSTLFDKQSQDQRLINTNFSAADFGNRFIVIPNPVYGDWEGAIYKYNRQLTPAQKDSVIRSSLKSE